jgi:hypothetical protein
LVLRRFLAAKVIWWCGLNRKAAPSRRAPQVTATGEKNGRLGYHPDLNPLLPPLKRERERAVNLDRWLWI